MLWALIISLAVPEASLRVAGRDAAGCIRSLELDGTPVDGAAPGLCVRHALLATLDAEQQVVLLVEVEERLRVFVYRVSGRHLVPRFLGSGFTSLRIRHASAHGDGLRIVAQDARGMDVALQCRFRGFPLVCLNGEETP